VSAPLVSLQGVRVSLGDAEVLRDVSFEIAAGSMLAVIGPNGAGKSTLVRSIDGLVPLQAGRILVGGADVSRMARRELARQLAYVPQADDRLLDFDVRSYVEMGRYPHLKAWTALSEEDRRVVEQALELTETAQLQHRSLASLSGGERQRVSVAAALAQGGRVLLLDEPTSFLDYRHQVQLIDLLERLCREQGLTIVAVSHDLNVAVAASDHVLALKEGCVVFHGTPAELFENGSLPAIFDTGFELVPVTGRATPLVIPVRGEK
jgi:iron complex transport system ATP-binding protein